MCELHLGVCVAGNVTHTHGGDVTPGAGGGGGTAELGLPGGNHGGRARPAIDLQRARPGRSDLPRTRAAADSRERRGIGCLVRLPQR